MGQVGASGVWEAVHGVDVYTPLVLLAALPRMLERYIKVLFSRAYLAEPVSRVY